MARLEIRLLGGFDVVLGGRPVTDFETASTQALLARLASNPGERLARPAVAELLWPDRPAGKALSNLRHSLAVLRRVVGDRDTDQPVLAISRDSISIDPASDVWIDLSEFRRVADTPASEPGAVAAWEAAVGLLAGSFLAGFDPALSEEWDTWLVTARASVEATAGRVYERLADLCQRTGERERALELLCDWIEFDRWNEAAHRSIIRLHALGGHRGRALDHAERFVAELRDELGAEPSDETSTLVDDVRSGRLSTQQIDVPGLGPRPGRSHREPCVAREREMTWLHRRLDDAATGAGGLVFVAGEAGVGKTVLLRSFAVAARIRMPELCVLHGACNAHSGAGDPFLPFRQILGLLCGDLERAWGSGALTPSEADRLWAGLPDVVEALLDDGSYLLGTLIDAPALGRRFALGYPEHHLGPVLATAIDLAVRSADDPMRQQRPILDQCVRVLTRLARGRPMLLIVDDLHWADPGTVGLLRHLAGQLTGAPILVVAAFRPSETAQRDGPDPVALMVHEARAHSRAECLLELAGTRQFVDEWLDTEPNLLDEGFRDRLFQTTAGHALFTVETVAAMRQRGDLIRDERGHWTTRGSVGWETLPPRVEATIAARTMQLPDAVRRDLEVASVQGESFVAEIVAEARGASPADVVLRLGGVAVPPHALVEPVGSEWIGQRRIERYRFRHALIRQYLSDHLLAPDRVALHGATGRALAEMYAARLDDVAVDLAHHFDVGGLVEQAIEYRTRVGRRALRLAAMSEAQEHLQRAVELVRDLPPSAERDRRELELLTPLGACLQVLAGYNAPLTDEVYERIRELIPRVGARFESAQALGALMTVDGLRARYRAATESTEQLLDLATQLGLLPFEAVARTLLGWLFLMTGRLAESFEQSTRVVQSYDDEWDQWLTYAVGMHVRSTALAWRALAAYNLGRPEQARRDALDSIAEARRIGYPFALTFALAVAGCAVHDQLREYERCVEFSEEEMAIADREDIAFYRTAARVHHGLAVAKCGRLEEGVSETAHALARWSETDTEAFWCLLSALHVERLLDAGRLDDADALLVGIEHRLETGEEWLAAYQLPVDRAALARARGDDAVAEAVLRHGIERQAAGGARGPQLRTATALAELLCDHDRADEAHSVLDPVLAEFTEGADNVDVVRAREVLHRAGG